MGVFVNPGNSAFQTALNSEIYVDKLACWNLRIILWIHCRAIFVTVVPEDSANPLLPICWRHTIARDAIRWKCFLDYRLATARISRSI